MSKPLDDAQLHLLSRTIRRALQHNQLKVFACLGEAQIEVAYRALTDVGVDMRDSDSATLEIYATFPDPGGPRERG